MELVNNYWQDCLGNRWFIDGNTKEQAIEKSNSLVGCSECIDCNNLENCTSCKYCHDCYNCDCCDGCENSHDLLGCSSCYSCDHCEDCGICHNCSHCEGCFAVKDLAWGIKLKIMALKLVDKVYKDKYNNRWNISEFTEQEATEISKSLSHCCNCYNCINCSHCEGCENCNFCRDCVYCRKCDCCISCKFCNVLVGEDNTDRTEEVCDDIEFSW